MVRFGDRMQQEVLVRQGDHAFVPADLPHAPCNESGAACRWLVCTRRAAIRTASCCCRRSMRFLRNGRRGWRKLLTHHQTSFTGIT